jgi:hypothetical protein
MFRNDFARMLRKKGGWEAAFLFFFLSPARQATPWAA